MRFVAIALIAIGLGACTTPQVLERPSRTADFSHFKTVAYRVHMNDQTEVGDDAKDVKYAHDAVNLLQAMLGAKLESIGYTVPKDGEKADLSIDVLVTEVKPGSTAARFWVGFGAGRAAFHFTARFTDAHGADLGSFAGGRLYTGMELNQGAFPSFEELATRAASRSADQIAEYIQGDGSLPKS
ncbi:MAG TPA: DUF4410 domain-containing protein [Steroidobacteraceae bacterium]|nr:DUF4410 domain-containing protein [Steroidobacteraceae bacterium]